MTTPVFCCGFECGQLAATGNNVGQHWFNSVAATTISTTTVRSGASALRINTTAAAATLTAFLGGKVARFYIRFATVPNVDAFVAVGDDVSDTGSVLWHLGVAYKVADGKLYPAFMLDSTGAITFGATGVAVTTGVWYRIDLKVDITDVTTFVWKVDLQVDGTAATQATRTAGFTGDQSRFRLGDPKTALTADIFYDDILISNTLADYPIGDGYVNHFVPTSDGTHTATTTTIVKGTIAAPTAGGNVAGATDVFNWVNGVPLLGGATDNTRLVNQQTVGATLYAECVFGPAPGVSTPTTGPRAVEVITADRQATTAVGDMHVKINDNGTEAVVLDRTAAAGVITDRFTTKQFATAPTGGAWTVTSGAGNFNNLRARFGYSSDATPDQYWRGIMVEAEFAAAVAATQLTPDLMHQAQMPALLAQ